MPAPELAPLLLLCITSVCLPHSANVAGWTSTLQIGHGCHSDQFEGTVVILPERQL
jgi:hypothetical protein